MTKDEYKEEIINKLQEVADLKYKMFEEFCKDAYKSLGKDKLTAKDRQFIEYGEYRGFIQVLTFLKEFGEF